MDIRDNEKSFRGLEEFSSLAVRLLYLIVIYCYYIYISINVAFYLYNSNMFPTNNLCRLFVSDSQMEQGYRSEVQERALVVSLQMFNLILERSVALLREELDKKEKERPRLIVDEDMQVLLPTIKVRIPCDY